MVKRIHKTLIGISMIMMMLLAGCSRTGETSGEASGEVSKQSEAESGQVASVESTDEWMPREVEDYLSRNCYQAFYNYVLELKETEWEAFQLCDIDNDKVDELIAVRQDPKSTEQDKRRFYLMDWEDHKISIEEKAPLTPADFGTPINNLEYYDKDYTLVILNAEGKSYIEGVTKKDKDFFHLVVGIIWTEDRLPAKEPERREAIEDYYVVSELGERTDSRYSAAGSDELLYQYKMPTEDVVTFYKEVFGWKREFSPDHDSTSEIGVRITKEGYLYGKNEIGWSDYSVITQVELSESELVLHAIIKSVYTDNKLADVTVNMAPDGGKYGYALTGYEMAQDTNVEPDSGRVMEELQEENLWIQYVMQLNSYSDVVEPVIKDLRYMENDEELFTANAKRLLPELKKKYEANPGKDGSNIAAKSTLLGIYEIGNNSKLLVYEDAAYGMVPPETGEGFEFGYCLDYYLLTPGGAITFNQIFCYDESFGDMPADRKGTSRFRHYFLGNDWEGNLAIDGAYASRTENFADELMFYASVGRTHDMTVDEEGWERYDEDRYVYGAYFRPDGTRIINQYDTWQIATLEYVSHGAFIKDPSGKTLFEEGPGADGYGYYVEGKKISIEKKPEDTQETFCDISLDDATKLVGEICYWEWENIVNVDLVFIVDGVEVHHYLYSYKIFV